jgi:transcriptional regulator with XRE-family HTH domain
MHEKVPESVPAVWVKLREKRRYLGVTQRELAAILGTPEHRVRRIELGEMTPCDMDMRSAQALLERWQTNPPERKPFNYGRPSKRPETPTYAREAVIGALRQTQEPSTTTEIVQRSGLCETAVRRHLDMLEAEGSVRRGKVWRTFTRNVTVKVRLPATGWSYICQEDRN